MSFGIQNLGVINQKDAPAIWESDAVDFPANFVKGRILIDTFFGGIYLDTSTTRVQIQANGSGTINYLNGITTLGLVIPTTSNVGLGGSLDNSTTININGNDLNFQGNAESVIINADGYLDTQNIGIYMPITEQTIVPLVPNVILEFTDGINGIVYQVLGRK